MKEQKFISLLDTALNDSEIQQNNECLELLEEAKWRLNKGEPINFVTARLHENIAQYLVSHNYKAPKALITLSKSFSDAPAKYRGNMSIAFWLSNLFKW